MSNWIIYKRFSRFTEAMDCKRGLGEDSRVIRNPNANDNDRYEVWVYENKNPFRSRFQMRRMGAMETRGELPEGTMHKWRRETKSSYRDLPERLHNPRDIKVHGIIPRDTRDRCKCGHTKDKHNTKYIVGKKFILSCTLCNCSTYQHTTYYGENPGAAWHRDKERLSNLYAGQMKHSTERDYYRGAARAHNYSAQESEKMGMNPVWQLGGKYYIGIKKDGKLKAMKIKGKITQKKYPDYRQFHGPYKNHLDLLLSMEEMLSKQHRNPPGRTMIYDNIHAIEAQKGKNSLWPNENFRHDFKRGATVEGMPDGSLRIKSKSGKRLWKNINYR